MKFHFYSNSTIWHFLLACLCRFHNNWLRRGLILTNSNTIKKIKQLLKFNLWFILLLEIIDELIKDFKLVWARSYKDKCLVSLKKEILIVLDKMYKFLQIFLLCEHTSFVEGDLTNTWYFISMKTGSLWKTISSVSSEAPEFTIWLRIQFWVI